MTRDVALRALVRFHYLQPGFESLPGRKTNILPLNQSLMITEVWLSQDSNFMAAGTANTKQLYFLLIGVARPRPGHAVKAPSTRSPRAVPI